MTTYELRPRPGGYYDEPLGKAALREDVRYLIDADSYTLDRALDGYSLRGEVLIVPCD